METKNEPIPKEIVAATAAEPESQVLGIDVVVPENADTPIDWLKVATTPIKVVACQQCMCCENTRELYVDGVNKAKYAGSADYDNNWFKSGTFWTSHHVYGRAADILSLDYIKYYEKADN